MIDLSQEDWKIHFPLANLSEKGNIFFFLERNLEWQLVRVFGALSWWLGLGHCYQSFYSGQAASITRVCSVSLSSVRVWGLCTLSPYKKVPWIEPFLRSRPCIKCLVTGGKREIDTVISQLIGRKTEAQRSLKSGDHPRWWEYAGVWFQWQGHVLDNIILLLLSKGGSGESPPSLMCLLLFPQSIKFCLPEPSGWRAREKEKAAGFLRSGRAFTTFQ